METRVDFLAAAAADGAAQLAQLLALEWLLGVGMPDKLKEAPLAIKVLYDEDIAEEVHPFLVWTALPSSVVQQKDAWLFGPITVYECT